MSEVVGLPEMTERMREIMEGSKPASPAEAVAATEEEAEVLPEEPEAPEAEVEPEPTPEEPEELDDVSWVREHLGFETDEKAAKAIREREGYVAKQGNEIGELRKSVEQERQEREAFQAQMQQQMEAAFEPDEEWEEWADAAVSENPLQAIIEAGQGGGPAAARYVLARWHAVDPAAATAFQVEAANVQAAPEVSTDASAAWDRVAVRHPDMAEYRDAMTTLVAEAPEETRLRLEELTTRDPDAALEILYLQAKVGKTDKQRADALGRANAAKKEAADRAAADSAVSTAGAAPSRGETVPLRGAAAVQAAIRAELGLEVPSD